MSSIILTNVSIYKAISEEAYLKMQELVDAGRTPKPDGSDGWVIKYDPDQRSFKQAMISIVFAGMWLEALMHLKIVQEFGEQKFREYDFKKYEAKLSLLGCDDMNILESAETFRTSRNELMHEKAYLDTGEIKKAQEEATKARKLMVAISEYFSSEQG